MLRELLSIFRSETPLRKTGKEFAYILEVAHGMVVKAGEIFFTPPGTAADREQIYQQDILVNKSERSIRKQVVTHLVVHGNTVDLPYCLYLMSLVKDVERIGDYAKNMAELADIHPEPLPQDDITEELGRLRAAVESALEATPAILTESKYEQAHDLIREGRELARRCDVLVRTIARSGYESGSTAVAVLAARYYKRINGHVLNILSSVVMPLHKLDYYDEDELRPEDRARFGLSGG
jgi:phosphate transport system protein